MASATLSVTVSRSYSPAGADRTVSPHPPRIAESPETPGAANSHILMTKTDVLGPFLSAERSEEVLLEAFEQGFGCLLAEVGALEEGGVGSVAHVAGLDEDLRHRRQVQAAEVVADV